MENASAPAPDPASNAYELMTKALRARGCRCMLMWNGVVTVPATICEQQEPGPYQHVCAVLMALPPVPEATSSDVRKLAEPTRIASRPLDASAPAGGD